jgi:polyisoprenoid-binding protein YceI
MIRAATLLIFMAFTAVASAHAETALDGTWVVDLTAGKGDAPYTKQMILKLADGGAVTGSFYDSDILAGRWKMDRGRTCVSFRTTDGAGPYHTAACGVGKKIQGQTWAEHRNFLFNWNAVRAK